MDTTATHVTTPTAEHPNAAVMREFFAAFAAADRDRLGAVMVEGPATSPGRVRSPAPSPASTGSWTASGASR